MANKPVWVEALDEAKKALSKAGEASQSVDADALTRVAYGWMDLAKIYKESPG